MSNFKSVVKTLLENSYDPLGPQTPEQVESGRRQSEAMKKIASKTYAEIMADALKDNPQFKGDWKTRADLIQSKQDEHADPAFQEHMKRLMTRLKF